MENRGERLNQDLVLSYTIATTPPSNLYRNWHVILIQPSQCMAAVHEWLEQNTKYGWIAEKIAFRNAILYDHPVPKHRVMFRSSRDASLFMIFFEKYTP